MRISTQLNYAGDFAAAATQAKALEDAGVDLLWVAEAYGFDAVSLLGYLTATTSRMELGSGILNIYSRTPTCLAQTAAGLDALSNGRFTLGLGASGPQVIEGFHGMPYDKPLARTREVIDICRQVWVREPVVHDGKIFTVPLPPEKGTGLGKPLKMINHPVRSSIPIAIASLGDKNVELTAEIADGWLPIFYFPERAGDVWKAPLAAGAAKRAADLGPLDVVAGGMLAIGDDVKGVLEFARPMAALYIGGMGARGKNFYNQLFQRYGYEAEAKEIQDLYLDGKKKEAAAAVPIEFLEATNLVGPEGYVKERLAAFAESGVTTLNVSPVGDAPKLVEMVKAWT